MILPTKRMSQKRSLLFIGGEILILLDNEKTVSRLWNGLKKKRKQSDMNSPVKFDWFILALDLLFMMKIIEMEEGYIKRVSS